MLGDLGMRMVDRNIYYLRKAKGRLLSFCLASFNLNSVLVICDINNLFAISQHLMLSKSSFSKH